MKLLCYHGRKITDRIIQTLSTSKYAHVAILLEDEQTILESHPPEGVRINKIESNFRGGFVDVYSFNDRVPEAVQEKFKEAVNNIIAFLAAGGHIDYDFAGVGAFVIKRVHENPEAMFCSELIAHIFEHDCGWPLFCVPAFEVTPCDISKSGILKFERQIKL